MDVIALSQRILSGLGSLDALPREDFGRLCKYILQVVVTGNSGLTIDESLEAPLEALSTLLLEAARLKSTADQIRTVLREQAVGEEVAGLICDLYEQHGGTLIAHMEASGIAFPELIGMDWRLDYSIRSKHGGRKNAAMYFVVLRVRDRGLPREVQMMASYEDLQDMLAKVKDAVKQVERVMNTTSTEN